MNVLLPLVVVANIAAQDLDRRVSAEVRAASAPVAIAELSKQVGYPLEAMVSTKEDILIIKVTDVPLRVLLQKISSATGAEWEQTANGQRLIRNDSIRRREAVAEQERLAVQIQEGLDRYKKVISEEQPISDRSASLNAERLDSFQERQNSGQQVDWREMQRLQSEGPAYRLLRKITSSLDAKLLASIPDGRRVVMSNMPNRAQTQLPGNIQPLIQQFVKDQTMWAKAIKLVRDRKPNQSHYYYDNMIDPSQRKMGKLILSLSRSAESRGIQVRIVLSDDRGRLVGQAQDNIGWDWEAQNRRITEAQATPNEPEIEITGVSQQITDAMREASKNPQANRGTFAIKLPPEAQQILLNPDKVEPLSLIPTECVISTAKIRDVDIVCVPTEMMIYSAMTGATSIKPATFLTIARGYGMETVWDGSWLEMRPIVGSETRKNRLDRVTLGQYIRQVAKDGRQTLENRSAFAYRSGMERESLLPTFLLSMSGILRDGVTYDGEWDTLRLYGSLTPQQRQAAKTGVPIPFQSLQRAQIDIFRSMVFDSPWSRLQVNYQQEDFALAQAEDNVIYGGGLDSEPTEILPNGFTGSEKLIIQDRTNSMFFSTPEREGNDQIMYGESAQDLNSLAQTLFQYERPEFFPWMSEPGYARGKITKVRTGIQRMLTFDVEFTRKVSLSLQLTDKTYSGESVTLDKLPADIKKQLEDALSRLREQYKNMKPPNYNSGGGGGGGVQTAPPRLD